MKFSNTSEPRGPEDLEAGRQVGHQRADDRRGRGRPVVAGGEGQRPQPRGCRHRSRRSIRSRRARRAHRGTGRRRAPGRRRGRGSRRRPAPGRAAGGKRHRRRRNRRCRPRAGQRRSRRQRPARRPSGSADWSGSRPPPSGSAPRSRARSINDCASAADTVSGFSTSTALPALQAGPGRGVVVVVDRCDVDDVDVGVGGELVDRRRTPGRSRTRRRRSRPCPGCANRRRPARASSVSRARSLGEHRGDVAGADDAPAGTVGLGHRTI